MPPSLYPTGAFKLKLYIGISAFLTFAGPIVAQVSLSQNTANIGAAGGAGSIQILATDQSIAWRIATGQEWFTLSSSLMGTGSGSIIYSIAANPTATARTARLVLTPASGNAQSFSLTQAGDWGSVPLQQTSMSPGARARFR